MLLRATRLRLRRGLMRGQAPHRRCLSDATAGAACPMAYRYRAADLAASQLSAGDGSAHTLFVVGGLYGNLSALAAIEALAARERPGRGKKVSVVFNGDFHFFDADPHDFCEINRRILPHRPPAPLANAGPRADVAAALAAINAGRAAGRADADAGGSAGDRESRPDVLRQTEGGVMEVVATAGNIELAVSGGAAGAAGCGCDYPAYVSRGVVERSDEIVRQLGAVASECETPQALSSLSSLPLFATFRVGSVRVGVIHGDPEMLSGWSFGVEFMSPPDAALRAALGCSHEAVTSRSQVEDWFRQAEVDVFACTHTCLPYAQRFVGAGRPRGGGAGGVERGDGLIFNNGSAGMANFEGTRWGLITRISQDLTPPPGSVYGCELAGPEGGKGVRVDAVKVPFDYAAFTEVRVSVVCVCMCVCVDACGYSGVQTAKESVTAYSPHLQRFLQLWPPGSAAHESYFGRITRGPSGYTLAQANRLDVFMK